MEGRRGVDGEPAGARTLDLLIKSQLLYQLSYRLTGGGGNGAGRTRQAQSGRGAESAFHFAAASLYAPVMPAAPETYPFDKMHGLGNDFVVIDRRTGVPPITAALARAMGDRHFGIGFDQLVEIEPDEVGVRLSFWNADGSRSAACGNATRCIAARLIDENGGRPVRIRTERGILAARMSESGVAVNMGHPILDWRAIPLARDVDVDALPLEGEVAALPREGEVAALPREGEVAALPLEGPALATGMGNPHCTFFVADAEAVDLARLGPAVEHHPLFPERTNVQVAQVIGPDRLRMRVWERGAGITLASGSSSCAVAVAAVRRGLTGRRVTVTLDGGSLHVEWRDDGVWMAGPTAHVASGAFTAAFLEGVAS